MVVFSANWVYIRSTGLVGHIMGPWPTNFPNFPSSIAKTYRIPRNRVIPVNKSLTVSARAAPRSTACPCSACVTPEFPSGTYAYFTTLKADGSPA